MALKLGPKSNLNTHAEKDRYQQVSRPILIDGVMTMG